MAALPATSGVDGPLTVATRRELEAAGRIGSAVGEAALIAARQLDSGTGSGSAVAALIREHRAVMAEAVRGAQVAGDPLDELRVKRDRKRAEHRPG